MCRMEGREACLLVEKTRNGVRGNLQTQLLAWLPGRKDGAPSRLCKSAADTATGSELLRTVPVSRAWLAHGLAKVFAA